MLWETFYFSKSSQWSHDLSENTENKWNDKIYSNANNLLHFLGTPHQRLLGSGC